MGRSFKAPASKDTEQWAKVEALHNAGFRFFSYRSFDCPRLPAKLSEVDKFIRDNVSHPMRVAAPKFPKMGAMQTDVVHAPKGRQVIAQGNALGQELQNVLSPDRAQ